MPNAFRDFREMRTRVRELGAYGGGFDIDLPNPTIETHFFKVTGPIDSGLHPATRYIPTVAGTDFEFPGQTETAWLFPSHGELLTKRIFYPCKLIGVNSSDGLCIYVPLCFQQTINGVLDGSLSYRSSATLSVYGNSGGSGATATSAITGDAVTSFTVTAGGTNYDWAPGVSLSGGGGTGAAGTATISSAGVVTGISVTSGGSGYTSAPAVAINSDSDTGLNVTVYDHTILSSGGSVAAGKFIVAFYDMMSRRWKLMTAQCA